MLTLAAAQRLTDLGMTLPLEELFLEGPVQPDDFAQLLTAIGLLPNLKRLALYQTRNPKPALLDDLARAAPQLTALVIVAGDSQEAVEWPMPLVSLPGGLSLIYRPNLLARQSSLKQVTWILTATLAVWAAGRLPARSLAIPVAALLCVRPTVPSPSRSRRPSDARTPVEARVRRAESARQGVPVFD